MIKDEWIDTALDAVMKSGARFSTAPETSMKIALSAVAPLIAAEERDACAEMVRNRNWMADVEEPTRSAQLYWAAVDTLVDHIAKMIRAQGDRHD
jgi:hypothetical protein